MSSPRYAAQPRQSKAPGREQTGACDLRHIHTTPARPAQNTQGLAPELRKYANCTIVPARLPPSARVHDRS